MKDRIVSALKNINTYRYLISVIFILEAIYRTIIFTNAGSNVEQAEAFRPLCIGLAIVILVNMEIKDWFNIWSLIYAPIAFVTIQLGYKKQWIFDINNYEFAGIIRLGKIIIFLWGVIVISVIRYLIKNKVWKKLKEYRLSLLIPLVLYFICILLFRRNYTEMLFFMAEVTGFTFIMKDKERRNLVIKAVIDAIIISFFYVMYMCLRHRPFDLERYDLLFNNSNNAGAYVAITVIAFFSKIDLWWKKTEVKKKLRIPVLVIYYLLLGISISVALFNYTRTTLSGLGFAFVVAFIMSLIKAGKGKRKGIVAKFSLVIASLLLTFNITYLALRYIPAYYAAYVSQPILYIGEEDTNVKIQYGDSMESPKYTSMNNYLRMVFGKWGILIKFEDDKQSEGQEESVVFDGRDVTGGRMEIWSMFIERLNVSGHYPFHITDETGYIIAHSHNSYLMVAYMLGVIAGLFYGILNIVLFIWSLIAVKKEEDKEGVYTFVFLIIATTLISQVAEWVSRPQYSLYMIFIFAIGVILNYKKNTNEEENDIKK